MFNVKLIPRLTKLDLSNSNKLKQAAEAGIFYYKVPDNIQINIGYKFGQNINEFGPKFNKTISSVQEEINKNPCFLEEHSQQTNIPVSTLKKGLKSEYCGFHIRNKYQVTSFYLEKSYWDYFDPNLSALLSKINQENQTIFKATLKYLNAPECDWDLITKGQKHAVFNNYNPKNNKSIDGLALNAHQDFGYVNILISNKSGLEIKIKDDWYPIEHDPEYFIVNYGKAFSLLRTQKEINAVNHRVVFQEEPRVSFGVSSEGDLNSPVWYYDRNNNLKQQYETWREYLNECFKFYDES